MMAGNDGMNDFETTHPNPCAFALTYNGFKIHRNYATEVKYYYVASD